MNPSLTVALRERLVPIPVTLAHGPERLDLLPALRRGERERDREGVASSER